MLEADVDKNDEKTNEISHGINRIKKAMRKRRQKDQKHREVPLRVNEIKIGKTEKRNTVHALEQTFSHSLEAKHQVKLPIKQIKLKNKNHPINPFAFTEYLEMKKEENEKDLGLFFELAGENKFIYKQVPVNTLIDYMVNMKNGLFTNRSLTLGDDEGAIDTNRFFKDSNYLAKFIHKTINKYDDHPSIYYTDNNYRFLKIFKRVNRFAHGRGANEINYVLEYESKNCYIAIGNACFLKCNKKFSRKKISMEYFEFIPSLKEELRF